MNARGIVAGVAAIFAIAAPAAAHQNPPPHEVRLVDQQGMPFSFASLQGTPLIVTFVATHCTDACPLVNAQFAQLSDELDRRHLGAKLVTLTLDPNHDTHRDMVRLARTFGARAERWIVASGNAGGMLAIMHAFGVIAEPGRDGYADAHTTFVYLLDSRGRLVKTMLPTSKLTDQLIAEVMATWPTLVRSGR